MQDDQNYINKDKFLQIGESYLSYLQDLHLKSNTSEEYKNYTETTVKDFIHMYYDEEFRSIYDVTESSYYDKVREEIPHNLQMRDANRWSGNEISLALKYYADFLRSKYNPLNTFNIDNSLDTPSDAGGENINKEEQKLTEGANKHVSQERRIRNPKLRKICIESWGYQCQCCGFDFSKAYEGEIGEKYIEVHHLRPISSFDEEHEVDPVHDLVPLCSNCHSMIHRGRDGVLSLEQLRAAYRGKTWEIKKKMKNE